MSSSLLGATKKNIADVAQLAEVTFFVGILYVFYLAPLKVVRGDSSMADKVAGLVGILFWVTAVVALSGGLR